MIPVLIAGAAAGVASTIAASAAGGVPPTQAAQNLVDRATAAVTGSDEPLIQRWERRNGGPRPGRIVPADGTAYPVAPREFLTSYYEREIAPIYPPGNVGQLAGLVQVLSPIVGGEAAAEVFATLASVEGGRGKPRDVGGPNGGNLRRFNPGNFKFARSRDAARPCFHLIDGAGSFDFYPAFSSWREGCEYWYSQVFGLARYRNASAAARRGDLRGFCRGIGEGDYATAYKRSDNALTGRYIDRVNAGALAGVLVKRGLLSGYAWRNGRAVAL